MIFTEERSAPLYLVSSVLAGLRVAVVHEWLTSFAGSEKVVEQILEIFPQAVVFTLVDHLPTSQRAFLAGRKVETSFLQKIPLSAKVFRKLLWLLPLAIESFDVSEFDIVISSSHAVAKGIITGPNQLHVCYCHSPIRYAWDLQHQYLRQSGLQTGLKAIYARLVLHYIRMWDIRTAYGVDKFIANSTFIARRIQKVYRRKARVIHPPVDVDKFVPTNHKQDFYLTASRLVPYKRIDLIVEAFGRMPNRKLFVIGEGEGFPKGSRVPPNVKFLGYQPDSVLRSYMGDAKAFVYAAEEDFGITVVEAQACGTPVICFGRGGALDTVRVDETGVLFYEQTAASMVDAVERFEEANDRGAFDPKAIRINAQRFSAGEFKKRFAEFVFAAWTERTDSASQSACD